jgi:hypothetical protein
MFCNPEYGKPPLPIELFPEHCRINEWCIDVAEAVKWMLKRVDDLETENKEMKKRVEFLEFCLRRGF